jgi:hypothetical protein
MCNEWGEVVKCSLVGVTVTKLKTKGECCENIIIIIIIIT